MNDNIDDSLFLPVIEYDLELTENDISWELINEIIEWDEIWGSGNSKITLKINDVFVEDKELFPPKTKEHVKIKTDKMDLMRFGDNEYANNIQAWDSISVIGNISVNEYNGDKRIQLFIEDYKK